MHWPAKRRPALSDTPNYAPARHLSLKIIIYNFLKCAGWFCAILVIALTGGCATIRPPAGVRPTEKKLLATAYCKCQKCCGWERSWFGGPVYSGGSQKGKRKKVGVTASGTRAKKGTVAADLSIYPFNTIDRLFFGFLRMGRFHHIYLLGLFESGRSGAGVCFFCVKTAVGSGFADFRGYSRRHRALGTSARHFHHSPLFPGSNGCARLFGPQNDETRFQSAAYYPFSPARVFRHISRRLRCAGGNLRQCGPASGRPGLALSVALSHNC